MISSVGLKMNNATVQKSAGLCLGAPVVCPHSCMRNDGYCWWPSRSHVVVVLVVTAATIRSTICFAVHSRVLARFLLVSLIYCVSLPRVKNVPMVLHYSAMETWTLSGMGCYLFRHLRPVCSPRKQCTSRFSGTKGGTQHIAEVCWCWLHSFCHRDLGSLGRAGLGVGIRDWSTSDINDAHEPRSTTFLQPFFVSRWLCCVETPNAFCNGYTPVIQLLWCLVTMIVTI